MGIAELPKIMAWCLFLTLALELFGAFVLGLRRRKLLFVALAGDDEAHVFA